MTVFKSIIANLMYMARLFYSMSRDAVFPGRAIAAAFAAADWATRTWGGRACWS